MFSLNVKLLVLLLMTYKLVPGHPLGNDGITQSRSSMTSSSSATSSTSAASAKPTSAGIPTPTPFSGLNNSSAALSLDSLFEGNTKFRSGNRTAISNLTSQSPSYMFIGCSDNRLSSGSIFQAPIGTLVSSNNIANQFSSKDANTDASLAYAVETLGVKHVIVLGHYGCKGVEIAITKPLKQHHPVQSWVQHTTKIFLKSRRPEIKRLRNSRKPQRDKKPSDPHILTAADTPGYRALVEENVKSSVHRLKTEGFLSAAYKKQSRGGKGKDQKSFEVYVHGFVYDESTGEVKDLRVSFGPPGKAVPKVPFAAVPPPEDIHKANHLPGIFKGKNTTTMTSSTSVTSSSSQTSVVPAPTKR